MNLANLARKLKRIQNELNALADSAPQSFHTKKEQERWATNAKIAVGKAVGDISFLYLHNHDRGGDDDSCM